MRLLLVAVVLGNGLAGCIDQRLTTIVAPQNGHVEAGEQPRVGTFDEANSRSFWARLSHEERAAANRLIGRSFREAGLVYLRPRIGVTNRKLPPGVVAIIVRDSRREEPLLIFAPTASETDLLTGRTALEQDVSLLPQLMMPRVLQVRQDGRLEEARLPLGSGDGEVASGYLIGILLDTALSIDDEDIPGLGRVRVYRFN